MNKYCPDCAHYQPNAVCTPWGLVPIGEVCKHPEARDLTGARRGLWAMRYGNDAPCGIEGKLFEPKPLEPKRETAVEPSDPEKVERWWRRMTS